MGLKLGKAGLLSLFLIFAVLPMNVVAEEVSADISVEKTVTCSGQKPDKDQTFSFILTGENAATPMPENGNTIQIKGNGKAVFGNIRYTEPGDYHYQVREEIQDLPYYIFDDSVYDVTVRVAYEYVGDKEVLETAVWACKEGYHQKTDISFVNAYKKTVSGTYTSYKSSRFSVPAVKTGDPASLVIWFIMLVLAGAALIGLRLIKIRKK